MLDHITVDAIPKGDIIFNEGDECRQMVFILSGIVRVYKTAESGREITLYRLQAGDSCILTASCIFSQSHFPAIAVAEDDVEVAVIPSLIFQEWVNNYEVWRNYIFNLISEQFSAIMAVLEEVAFRRMDIRVANLLLKLSSEKRKDLKIKHQEIALELGSSREVVSRILEQFAYENIVELKRGTIILRDIDKLKSKLTQEKF
ncbi:MAG: Crp/Fnr family transcriptional regulator [Nitrospiraceae bacterium]|nr:MAG: Crp/Fnr family transcriptional regulator [Nitrospiraceae bacterium]